MYTRITHPKYRSDQEWDNSNPITVLSKTWIPGIICPKCGVWSNSIRTYRKILDEKVYNYINIPPLSVEEWRRNLEKFKNYLGSSCLNEIFPGEEIGTPEIEITNS